MASGEKVLWVVNYDDLQTFSDQAVEVGATAVAIRSDCDLVSAIDTFHDNGMNVYAWRWPSAKRDVAMNEANKIVGLFAKGLDGYYVDPEGAPGKPYDWNQSGLDQLADDFCRTITAAGAGKPFGVTSHYRGKLTFPNIPWATFFRYATVLLPQAYWRSTEGVIGHGIPDDNYKRSLDFWAATGGDRAKIRPMAGELPKVTGAEIDAYVAAAAGAGVGDVHFYEYSPDVTDDAWNAVARA